MTVVPIFVGTCDLKILVASGHNKIERPPAANLGFRDFKDVVAFGNNQLWRPLAAKVQGVHSGLSQNMVRVFVTVDVDAEIIQCHKQRTTIIYGGLRPLIWVSVTSKMLLPSATTNCGGLWPQKLKVITVGYPKKKWSA